MTSTIRRTFAESVRHALVVLAIVGLSGAGCARTVPVEASVVSSGAAAYHPTPEDGAFVDTLARRTFDFFWQTTNPRNGLTPDRWPTKSFSSVAAVGFALTAYPIGVEHGWVTREAARERVLTTLRFFWNAPQGPQGSNVTGYHGFFYHFLDMETGYRFDRVELSTIDTALLLAGALTCRQYFDRDDAGDREVRALADSLYARVDWTWASDGATLVNMGWRPDSAANQDARGFNISSWYGILAPGATPKPIIAALNDALVQIVKSPAASKRLLELGVDPVSNTPEQFDALIRADIVKWGKVAKAANIKVN